MGSLGKSFAIVLILIMAISSLSLIMFIPLGLAQTGTIVTGIISSDTSWTLANSPYNLTGPVAILHGVTLTIEPGVIVDINGHYIQVNGTLYAKGTINSPIHIGDGQITFTSISNSWDDQTSSGSILENINFGTYQTFSEGNFELGSGYIPAQIDIYAASPKINSISYASITMYDGCSSEISNCNNLTIASYGGKPLIDGNLGISGITVTGNPSIISNNTIVGGGIEIAGNSQGTVITRNSIVGNGISDGGIGTYISDNDISDGGPNSVQTGILADTTAIIEHNSISDYGIGIDTGNALIQNNTISNNSVGIRITDSGAKIIYNNILNNVNNVAIYGSSDVTVNNNWWGTTDQQKINQTIYDAKNDFNLGTVNFVPFLNAPNPEAAPDQNATLPTSISTQSPITTPTVPEFPTLAILPLFISLLFVAVILTHRKITKLNQ